MQGKPLVLLLSVLYGSAFIAGFNENLVNMALVSIMAEYGVDSVTAVSYTHLDVYKRQCPRRSRTWKCKDAFVD